MVGDGTFFTSGLNPSSKYSQQAGPGSHSRRKAIINAALANKELFNDLLKDSRTLFQTHTDTLQNMVQKSIASFLKVLKRTFDLVRRENVARESERDPDFRLRVEEAINNSRGEIKRIHSIVSI